MDKLFQLHVCLFEICSAGSLTSTHLSDRLQLLQRIHLPLHVTIQCMNGSLLLQESICYMAKCLRSCSSKMGLIFVKSLEFLKSARLLCFELLRPVLPLGWLSVRNEICCCSSSNLDHKVSLRLAGILYLLDYQGYNYLHGLLLHNPSVERSSDDTRANSVCFQKVEVHICYKKTCQKNSYLEILN